MSTSGVKRVLVAGQMDFEELALRSRETALHCKDKSLAQQSFAEEADINTIARRFGLDGKLPDYGRMPVFGDFTGISDFHSAANAMALAGEAFDALPARVRTRFDNEPGLFVDFCLDPKNAREALELGLLSPAAVERIKAAEATEDARKVSEAIQAEKRAAEAAVGVRQGVKVGTETAPSGTKSS